MRPVLVVALASLSLLTGCAQLAQELTNSGVTFDPNRTYAAPVIAPTPNTQPNFQSFSTPSQGGYQNVMVETKGGYVMKRCKMLNGNIVHCL